MKLRKTRRGFTIVELVIVVAVIGVLAAVLIPTFVNLTNKANKEADNSLVKNLNTALAGREGEPDDTPNYTMHDAIEDLEIWGYKLENLTTKSNEKLLWNRKTNRFLLESKLGEQENNNKPEEFWKIIKNVSELEDDFSHYARNNLSGSVTVHSGFDVGESSISEVNYVNESTTDTKDIVIRTAHSNCVLTIDDSSLGSVYHYGSAGSVNIIKCHTSSYHANARVAFLEVAKGRVVLESQSDVDHIHINAKDSNDGFDTIIIENDGAENLPESITRDEVDIDSQTLVVTVESNGASESVYVYPNGSSGSTEKTSTQNTDVESELGGLVLDNGSESKALSEDEKEETKEAVVDEFAAEEIEEEIEEGANYIARIGNVGYPTLQAAWNEGKGKTVVLLQDLTQNGFYAYGKYTLDLDGHALSLKGHSSISGAFGTDGGANREHTNLTIKNGTLNLTGEGYSTYGIYNYGTLTLKDLTINSACQTVIYSNGQQWGTAGTTTLDNVTINATHSSGTAVAAYAFKSSWAGTVKPNVVIKNSTITAAYNAVMMYGVDATVENCVITATNNNALWISNAAMASGVTGTITVKGNTTVVAGSDYKRLNAQSNNVIVVVEGTYNFDPSNCNSKNYVDGDSYNVTDNGNGTWTVTAK